MNKRQVLYAATAFSGLVFLLLCAYPHYLRRSEEYKKHEFVIDNHCDTSRPHPSIHYNAMTYDGTMTNCADARAFTSMPVLIGAFIDLWLVSPIPGILYATSWQMQMFYALMGCTTIVCAIVSYRKYVTDMHVIEAVSRQKGRLADGRQRLVVGKAENITAVVKQ